MKLILPFPPLDNHYYTVSRGRKVLSKKGRAYAKEVSYTVKPERILNERVILTIIPHHQGRYRYDIGNCIKCICDVLGKINAYVDDIQIDKLIICRGTVDKSGGYVEIELEEIKGDMFDEKHLNSLRST